MTEDRPDQHPARLRVAFVPGVTPDKWARIWAERMPRVRLDLSPVAVDLARSLSRPGDGTSYEEGDALGTGPDPAGFWLGLWQRIKMCAEVLWISFRLYVIRNLLTFFSRLAGDGDRLPRPARATRG